MTDPSAPNAETATAPRVLLVDSHPVVRNGLTRMLRAEGLDVVGEADDARAAVVMAGYLAPEVILMNLPAARPSAVDDTRLVAASAPRSGLVVFTTTDEEEVLGHLLAGASGCLLKDAPLQEIVAAIRAAARGESVMSPPIAGILVRRFRRQHSDAGIRRPHLTPRELEVLKLLVRGWDNARIAAALYVGRGTVKHHISSILDKLQVENRIQAAVRAVEYGLLET